MRRSNVSLSAGGLNIRLVVSSFLFMNASIGFCTGRRAVHGLARLDKRAVETANHHWRIAVEKQNLDAKHH